MPVDGRPEINEESEISKAAGIYPFPNSLLLSVLRRFYLPYFCVCSSLCTGWLILNQVLENWDYYPERLPISRLEIFTFKSLIPNFFLFVMIPIAVFTMADSLISTLRSLISGQWRASLRIFILVCVVLIPLIALDKANDVIGKHDFYLYGVNISNRESLINAASSRYDTVIDAIEQFQIDHGHYPPSLQVLLPDYISSMPGMYMKYGEKLIYNPVLAYGSNRYGPFTFELYGHVGMAGIHGQTLKYCPVNDETCQVFRQRINDRWIFTFDSEI